MTIQLTSSSFLQLLHRSRLLTRAGQEMLAERLADPSLSNLTAGAIADWLVQKTVLTRWQADKLLQAKHRGFFLGPYRLQYRVARGGMSTIYAGQHVTTGEIHALKVLPPTRVDLASYLPRFLREAEIAKKLQHPNIVRVFDVHLESDGVNDVHFMAMELLHGHDLAEIVRSEGALPCFDAADTIRQAATGLAFAHAAGLVHRDIKPGNLFRTTDGVIRILDLGLAQNFESNESLTRDYNERVLGTADYLSPEQAVDSHTADARADLYSLGCTLYFLLTGQPPFNEGSLMQRILAHQSKEPTPVSSFRSDVPTDLLSILERMMRKDRTQRIQSSAEVVDLLTAWLRKHRDRDDLKIRPPHLVPTAEHRALTASDPGQPSAPSLTAFPSASHSGVDKSSISSAEAVDRKATDCSPFLPEFLEFLMFLDHESGSDSVMTPQARRQHLIAISSTIPGSPSLAAGEFRTKTPDRFTARPGTGAAAAQSAAQSADRSHGVGAPAATGHASLRHPGLLAAALLICVIALTLIWLFRSQIQGTLPGTAPPTDPASGL